MDRNDLDRYLDYWIKIWNWEVEIEKMNLRVSAVYESFGSFAEGLCAILFDAKGDSSSGLGYDLKDRDGKVYEVKSCIKHKNKDCPKCGLKNVYVNRFCYDCKHILELTDSTSRFSINSKKIVEFKDNCKNILFVLMENINWDKKKITVWSLDFSDKKSYFYKYALNQYEVSKKSYNLNFLPFSYDFMLSEPIKEFEITFISKESKLCFEKLITVSEKDELIQEELLNKREARILKDRGVNSEDGSYKVSDVKKYIGLRKKNLNKPRGEIKRRA